MSAIALNGIAYGAGGSSFLDASSGGFLGDTGVRDPGSSTLTYSAAVPEPSTLAIFGIGACVAGIRAARRRRREN